MRNVLLIGGAGFIGANIVERLALKECNVFILELPGTDIVHLLTLSDKIKVFYGELEHYDFIKEILHVNSIDTVLHLVSTLIPSSSLDSYIVEFEKVIKPTIHLLHLLSQLNIKLVYFSSGGTIYGVKKTGIFSETDKTAPISYYGQSKLIIEESIRFENRKSGLKYLILRPSNPYGRGQRIRSKQGLIATSIGHILYNEKIRIWGDGNVIRDYIYIDDFIDAVMATIEIGGNNQTYNIGSGKGYSINQVIKLLSKCTDRNLEVEYVRGRSVDVPLLVLDVSKLHRICTPSKISLERGVGMFYNAEVKKKR